MTEVPEADGPAPLTLSTMVKASRTVERIPPNRYRLLKKTGLSPSIP